MKRNKELIEQVEKNISCCEKQQLSLYLHIPFCVKKCLYCDFLSFESDQESRNRYVKTLIKEIEKKGPCYKDYELKTIFFGGGTPSLLNEKQLSQIMDAIKMHFHMAVNQDESKMEISMEINPGTVTEEKLRAYYLAGINRISIGLQSANNQELKVLGRIHTYEDFRKTYQMARMIGFQNVNVDIMSALPNQTLEQYKDTLEKILNLEPEVEHISA
jgi:oxygen-independent coproporphyrinogen III oxidase